MILIINGEEREVGLREAWNYMKEEDWKAAARKAELDYFFSTHKYCCSCGEQMQLSSEISMRCPKCGREDFPSLAPAVLVLVKHGSQALLVHARNFSRPIHALVAGFVETGENLEECVRREVREETSLEIKNIRYFASQSWPFPSQLMVAFTAEYDSGELIFADGELTSGGWFTRENPPELPTMPSLSRQLINSWLNADV